jgi:hypothetical protein
MQSKYWRVQMAWPESHPRYFGKFDSRAEAEKWIEKHDWLTEQNQEPDEKPTKRRQWVAVKVDLCGVIR